MDLKHELTLLSAEELFGDNTLEIIKKYGRKCAITDLAILTGAGASNCHIEEDSSLTGRTGSYWTKSDDVSNDVRIMGNDGFLFYLYRYKRYGIVRPVLRDSSIFSKISTNIVRGYNGVEEVAYGEYPQMAADERMQVVLESEYLSGKFTKTGRSYTFDSRKCNDFDSGFSAIIYEEYEYNGEKYIRVKANSCYDGNEFQLSNGTKYRDGDYVWVEVSPVIWLVDEKTGTLVSKKGLVSGIRYLSKNKKYKGDFDSTEMKKYLDKYMAKDLFQTVSLNLEEKKKRKKEIKNSKAYKIEEQIEKLYTGESNMFPGKALRQIWDDAKKDEIILGETLKTIYESDIKLPYLSSLILMDHENIDPLAYDCLRRLVINYNSVKNVENPFLKEYNYNLLTTLLFNQKLVLTEEEKRKILCYILYSRNLNIEILKGVKYWLFTHPSATNLEKILESLFDNEYIKHINIEDLLINYEERAKLRKLTQMPF